MQGKSHVVAEPYTEWAEAKACVPACMLHVFMNVDICLWSAALASVTHLLNTSQALPLML